MKEERRYKFIQIDSRMLPKLFLAQHTIKFHTDIPPDAEPIATYFDETRQVLFLLYYHDSFDIVPEGAIIPTGSFTVEVV